MRHGSMTADDDEEGIRSALAITLTFWGVGALLVWAWVAVLVLANHA